MDSKLNEARLTINKIDDEMQRLFLERMHAVKLVAEYKNENNLAIFVPSRENEMKQRLFSNVQDAKLLPYYKDFFENLIENSKEYQKSILDLSKDGKFAETTDLAENIILARDALKKAGDYFDLNRKVLIITDSGIPSEYIDVFKTFCNDYLVITIVQGEENKSFENFKYICETMIKNEFTRTDCVVAIGGGVVGDLAGFVASSFMRGVDFYNIPTTLLSQIDSSIGGKTAIDHLGYKNMIGSFYQPKKVLIDPNLLKTLSDRHMKNGIAEIIKESICFDADLFELVENTNILSASPDIFDSVIENCLLIKQNIVNLDSNEKGLRKKLNFGHTVGHAIESLSSFFHGECIAIGMTYFCENEVRKRLIPVLEKYDLPTATDIPVDELFKVLVHDKKRSSDEITIVYCPEVGKCELNKISLETLAKQYINLKQD